MLITVVTAQSGRVIGTKFHFTDGISVLDFGAKCDGITDDSLALQNAVNAADTMPYTTLHLPAAKCIFNTPLVIGNHLNRYCMVNIIGQGEYISALVYTGSMDKSAIEIRHCSAFEWKQFSLSSVQYANFSTHGTSVGILLDRAIGAGEGTFNTTITFDHIAISGFHIGMQAGNESSASEIDCRQCGFTYNDIGWTASNYNSLNFWFYGVHLGQNQIGMKIGGPWVTDAPHIIGGDSANNSVADFYFGNSFGIFSIENFRAEIITNSKFITGMSIGGFPQVVSIKNSIIIGQRNMLVMDLGGLSINIDGLYAIGLINLMRSDSCAPTAFKSAVEIKNSLINPISSDNLLNFPQGFFKFKFERLANNSAPPFPYLTDKSGFWNCNVLE